MSFATESYDLTGDEPVLETRIMVPPESLLRQIPRLDERARDLVVVRESAVYDHTLMEGCVQHTLSYCTSVPGHAVARQVGLDPLLRPEALPTGVVAVPLAHRGTKAVLFSVDGTLFFYSEASAAKTDARGDNQWTLMLNAVIERLRPERLHVVALSRLVRSFEMAGLVHSAVTRHVDTVFAGGSPIRMRGEGQEMGQLMWSTLATISASERHLIVQRLTAGVVAKYLRGEWVRGVASQPLGYVYDPAAKNLRLDDTAQERVALAWTLLADPRVTAEKLVRLLGDAGVLSSSAYGDGPRRNVGDLRDPATYVAHLLRYASLYRTGRHVQRHRNPFPGSDHISALPVLEPSADYPDGHVEFSYDWGLPQGGWVDDSVISTALEVRRSYRPRTGGRARKRVAPLTGAVWVQDESEFMIQASARESYELRVRKAGAA